ncbi:MAG: carboxylesterase/lipase family protein [Blastocatellia bacterium]
MLKKANLVVLTACLLVCGLPGTVTKVQAQTRAADGAIKVDSGMISGVLVGENKDVSVYKGIPYAAPPVGDLRWKAPQPVKAWTGVRECTEFGNAEPQPNILEMVYGMKLSKTSEDCLYLNVYVPAKRTSGKLPVMVWIHGGGFYLGEGATYDGENLARLGAIVVTINYRLGVFGFFAHPALSKQSGSGVSGNYGMLDQIAALKWVKRNIAAFGGDATRVTVFGESAGGMSVAMLMVSPLSEGLFHRAIIESGVGFGPARRMNDIEKLGTQLCDSLGVSKDADPIAALRSVSAEDLLKKAGAPLGGGFGPAVDGWFLPDDPAVIFAAGKEHGVPLIIGSNHNEGTILLRAIPMRNTQDYENYVKRAFGAEADAVLKLYPPSEGKDAMSIADRVFSDRIAAGSEMFAESNSKLNPKSYLYHFTKSSNSPRFASLGAYHAAEIPYVFDANRESYHFDDADKTLAKTMSAYWVRFAATGDPNEQGLPEWPKVEGASGRYIEFGTEIKTGSQVVSQQAYEVLSRSGGQSRAGRQ